MGDLILGASVVLAIMIVVLLTIEYKTYKKRATKRKRGKCKTCQYYDGKVCMEDAIYRHETFYCSNYVEEEA